MKRMLVMILYMLVAVQVYGNDTLKVFYRIRLDRDIDKAAQRQMVEGLKKAAECEADYILLDLDTYGGAVHTLGNPALRNPGSGICKYAGGLSGCSHKHSM